jgi:hypothetical protein
MFFNLDSLVRLHLKPASKAAALLSFRDTKYCSFDNGYEAVQWGWSADGPGMYASLSTDILPVVHVMQVR